MASVSIPQLTQACQTRAGPYDIQQLSHAQTRPSPAPGEPLSSLSSTVANASPSAPPPAPAKSPSRMSAAASSAPSEIARPGLPANDDGLCGGVQGAYVTITANQCHRRT